MRFSAFSKSSFSRRRSSYLRPARSKYVKINGRKKIRVNPEKRDRYYSSKTHNFCNSHLPTAAHLDATIPWYCLATAPKIPFTSPLMMLLYRLEKEYGLCGRLKKTREIPRSSSSSATCKLCEQQPSYLSSVSSESLCTPIHCVTFLNPWSIWSIWLQNLC